MVFMQSYLFCLQVALKGSEHVALQGDLQQTAWETTNTVQLLETFWNKKEPM